MYKAVVIADTVNKEGFRITTMELEFPRFLLPQLNTHRIISKNAASSRAIPFKRRKQLVLENPVFPIYWGANKPGMQADEEIESVAEAEEIWAEAMEKALHYAERLDSLGVHKQVVNRLIEPFTMVRVVVTSTEWSNFFNLRLHHDAQPEMQELARNMKEALDSSEPEKKYIHVPYLDYYTDDNGIPLDEPTAMMISAARCARVSYKTHDGKTPTMKQDLDLAKRLYSAGHLSPFEHQALSVGEKVCRQYVGWKPFRVYVEREMDIVCSRLNNNVG